MSRSDAACLVALLLATTLFLAGTYAPGENELIQGADLHWLFRIAHRHAIACRDAGELPLWNPALFCGFPHHAEPQLSTFYPPLVWSLALDETPRYAILYAAHLFLSAAGGYALARRLGCRPSCALFAGLACGLNLSLAGRIHAGHLPHVMTQAYLPWTLLATHWACAGPRGGAARAVVAGIPLALAALAGYVPHLVAQAMAAVAVGAWHAFAAWRGHGRRAAAGVLGRLALLAASAIALSAVQVLPALEMASRSSRVARASTAQASEIPLAMWSLPRLFLPNVYGTPVSNHGYWAPDDTFTYWEHLYYPGTATWVLVALAVVAFRDRRTLPWLALGLVFLVLAMGPDGAAHRLLADHAPGIAALRAPTRMAYVFTVAVAIASALTLERWCASEPRRRRAAARRVLWITGGAVAVALAVAGGALVGMEARTGTDTDARLGDVVGQLVRAASLAVATAAVLWSERRRSIAPIACCALFVVDVWGPGRALIGHGPVPLEPAWEYADAHLPRARAGWRVAIDGPQSNAAPLVGLQAVGGFDDFRTEASMRLEELVASEPVLARLAGARYLLVGRDRPEPPREAGWTLAERDPDGHVAIYARTDACPRAWVVHGARYAPDLDAAWEAVFDPAFDPLREVVLVGDAPPTHAPPPEPSTARVRLDERGSSLVEVLVTTPRDGWLVVAHSADPGWTATVDGLPTVVATANYAFVAVAVPAGRHRVALVYAPPALARGKEISLVGLVLLLVALARVAATRSRAVH